MALELAWEVSNSIIPDITEVSKLFNSSVLRWIGKNSDGIELALSRLVPGLVQLLVKCKEQIYFLL